MNKHLVPISAMFAVGDYKRIPNEVADRKTAMPENAPHEIARLLDSYDPKASHTLEQIVDFHVRLERIHPFQDSNGRVGRLVMLKECLSSNIVPFVISDEMKLFYYRGLSEWDTERGFSSMRVCMPKIASSNGWNTSASPTTNRDALHCSRVPSCEISVGLHESNALALRHARGETKLMPRPALPAPPIPSAPSGLSAPQAPLASLLSFSRFHRRNFRQESGNP